MKNSMFNLFLGILMFTLSICHAETTGSNNLIELKKKLELAEAQMLENPTPENVKKYKELTIDAVELANRIANEYHYSKD